MTLAELQGTFQRAILAGEDEVLAHLAPGGRESTEVLLEVYRNAYWLRLVEIVGNDHERLSAYMGEQPFAEMVRAYFAQSPSTQPNARWISDGLPDFLARKRPYANYRQLADLARLERTLNLAFDCRDVEVVGIEALAAIAPERWGDLRFAFHPSARRLDLTTNAVTIWQALKAGEATPEARLCDPAEPVLVWRGDLTPMLRVLGAEEAMAWDRTAAGLPFGALCALLAEHGDPDDAAVRAAGHVQSWLLAGVIAAVDCAEPGGES